MRRLGLIFIALAVMVSCKSKPEPVELPLSTEKFTMVMIDVQLAEGMKTQKIISTRTNADELVNLYKHIFEKHGVKGEDFMETYAYYSSHPGEMELIYEQVLDSLSKLDVEVKKAYADEVQAETDSIQEATRRTRDSIQAIQQNR